jgi:hypothetical protein
MLSLKLNFLFALLLIVSAGTLSARSTQAPAPKLSVLQCFQISDNIVTGHVGKQTDQLKHGIRAKEKELQGLSYSAVIPWTPKRRDALKRIFIEKLDLENPNTLPRYDRLQKLGKAQISLRDIRFSQINCRNMSQDKKYSVVSNAKAIKEGTLDIKKLPTIRVWRDVEGRIWTLDHRRLAAMRLSGVVEKIEVEYVSEELVKAQKFKFSTHNSGKSIFVHLDEPEAKEKLAIVLMND